MKSFRQFNEDGGAAGAAAPGPSVTVSGGGVAGIGYPSGSKFGEPGVYPKKKKKYSPIMMKMGSRKAPK